jgi:Flp pilus assembly protein TadG
VELALLLPFLCFLFVIAVDFARAFYFSLTLSSCARNGALYLSDEYARAQSPYRSVEEAALADAANLNDAANPPRVTSTTGTDGAGYPYVEVTVTWQFRTITNFPGVPSAVSLARTVRMRQAPPNPPTT